MKVLAIFGPTGVGKTEVAIEVAKLLRDRGEDPVAVSSDALQVYSGLDVLTNKPSSEELRQLEHRLQSFVPIEEPCNAYHYSKRAHKEIDRLIGQGRRPIVVGGTGLYLRAALAELDMRPARSEKESQLWSASTRLPTQLFGLVMSKEALYRRINERVDRMIANGARAEVLTALEKGASFTVRKAIGFELLAGSEDDNSVAAEMKRATRNYAKRQLTWMRKMPNLEVIDITELTAIDAASVIVADID